MPDVAFIDTITAGDEEAPSRLTIPISPFSARNSYGRHDPNEPVNTRPGQPDFDPETHGKGRVGTILTPGQAKVAFAAMHRAEVAANQSVQDQPVDVQALPVVVFPTLLRHEDPSFNGDIGQFRFEMGVSTSVVSYRRAVGLSAAGYSLFDNVTGAPITFAGEQVTWRVDPMSSLWNIGQELPAHAVALLAERLSATAALRAAESSQEAQAATKAAATASTATQAPTGAAGSQQGINTDKITALTRLIGSLRPGHKEDWIAGGMPNSNRLSALLTEDIAGKEVGYVSKVSKAECLLAFQHFKVDKLEPDQNLDQSPGVFAVPTSTSARAILEACSRTKGAKVLRQFAVTIGIETPPRETEDLIAAILTMNPTPDQMRGL